MKSLSRRSTIGLLAGSALAQQRSERPNILFILVDDLRWDGLSCLGHPYASTPHIDRLAREGAIFRNAFVTTPLCSPSRATFLSGQYAHRHKIVGNEDHARYNPLSHQLRTWPQQLSKAGYETAYIGKLHMGNDDMPRAGIDHWVSFRGQGQYANPQFNVNGERVKKQGYMTDLLNSYALDFLDRKREKPFAMVLAHKAVHGPFTPAERHKDLYAGSALPSTANRNTDLRGKPMLQLPTPPVNPPRAAAPKPVPGFNLPRAQMQQMASIDEGVGLILEKLAATGQLDRTMIIFSSDNGYLWGEHGLGDKRVAYEESIRIPFLVRYPKLASPGLTVEGMIANVDLAPSLIELAGAEPLPGIQGRSWLPLLRRKPGKAREALALEYVQEPAFPRIRTWRAVRTSDWKYIQYPDLSGADELYNLRQDPYEMNNQIDKEAGVLKRMQQYMVREFRSAI